MIVPEERLSPEEPFGSGDAANAASAELVGYGPVDTQTARKVAGLAASWERVMVSMMTGDVLSADAYRPSAAIKRFLAARDLRCRAPGCNVTVGRSDIDHTIDAALGGPTSTDNLATLCRYHHTMKHHPGWKLVHKPGGVMEWETPLGKKYTDRPGSRVRFQKRDVSENH
ncbi:HNH endonuclease [Leucobacter coleopterorum]|uniref:HNH endonuclease n=1 Tax=Leucobacter coleopterorum TaxID=2714933 RepID=A0ABX6K021_9MICO|nr:HNH endonuclease signature motif containing protein [Leucobacter coleopterorum]QIM18380.1 HNH endonuclease [Leucobacter coleopterorum]